MSCSCACTSAASGTRGTESPYPAGSCARGSVIPGPASKSAVDAFVDLFPPSKPHADVGPLLLPVEAPQPIPPPTDSETEGAALSKPHAGVGIFGVGDL